jgi:pimeloyl-ACP methyl ester carboxylesterase
MFAAMSPEDKTILSQPNVTNPLGQMVVEAYRRGTRGVALDWKIEALPWGFPLSEIGIPVHIWHGGQDKLGPPDQARLLSEPIPDARLKILPNEGHTLFLTHLEELLETTIC